MADVSVYEREAQATAFAYKDIVEPIKAAHQVLSLASKVQANDTPEKNLPRPKAVRLLLLQRIQNDLRCCVILIERGYAFQASSLATGIYEAWVTLANIKTDVDAVKWLSHDDETKAFGEIKRLTKNAAMHYGRAQDSEKFYDQYRQLCMPKHLNPFIERLRGYDYDVESNSVVFRPGPDTSEFAIKMGWFTLECASRFAFAALCAIADYEPASEELRTAFESCQVVVTALNHECARRWPTVWV
jgi:hypothetical protein